MAKHAIGIDLGTTYSLLATINEAGKPEIVPNKEGERQTASSVYFQKSGPILVGTLAVDAAGGFPDRVVRWIKREMGNGSWQFPIDGHSYTPVDISAIILAKVKKDSEVLLGPLEEAVITVPAYFDEIRRKATMDAAEKAGLKVLRIINEPTAAALAYAATGKTKGKVLVYDFGGGTFDVSIVDIVSAERVDVISSEGDHQLGGFDLDKRVAEHLSAIFQEKFGKPILSEGSPAAKHSLFAEAERAKKRLSSLGAASQIPLSLDGQSMNATLERSKFELLIQDLLVRTEMLIDNALSQADLRPDQIASVLLVGGSSRIPCVTEMLKRKFKQDPIRHVNPDEAVALGAAIQAGVLMQQKGLLSLPFAAGQGLARTKIQDVTNHSFGTIYLGEAHGRDKLRNMIMIRKNSTLPTSKTETFTTHYEDQREVRCRITQGEDSDPEFVNVISEDSLSLPAGRPAGCEIKVTYSYDINGRMSCEFLDVATGRNKLLNLDLNSADRKSSAISEMDDKSFENLEIE